MLKMMVMDFWFQLCHEKGLEVITPVLLTRKKLNKLKIDNFSWTHQRIKVTGKTGTTKSGEAQKYTSQATNSSSGTEATGTTNWQEPSSGDCDDLLEAECGVPSDETLWGPDLRGQPHSHGFYLQESHQFLQKQNPLVWQEEEKIKISEILQNIFL